MADDWRAEQIARTELHRERVFSHIAIGIADADLYLAPLEDNANEYMQRSHKRRRFIISRDGERLGEITFVDRPRYAGGSGKERMRIYSPRIPKRRNTYSSDGYRDYQKLPSAIAAIIKFCHPTSPDEVRAEEIRKEIQRIRRVVSAAYNRSTNPEGKAYAPSNLHRSLIDQLASDEPMDVETAQEKIRVLVRKRRAHNRFTEWVQENKVKPLREELNTLDLSKEDLS
jgi:hypothetical protein